MLARLIVTLTLATAVAPVVVGTTPVAPAGAAGASGAAAIASDVTPTTLPPSEPGRLAYSTATYYGSGNGGGLGVHGLGTIGLDGSDQRTLSDPQPPAGTLYAGYDHSPQWSPDGTWLAYTQDRPGAVSGTDDSVVAMPRDGGEPQVVDTDAYAPAWSPDGRHLAWVSMGDDGSRAIEVADVETTTTTLVLTDRRTVLAPEHGIRVGWPTFSPDGSTLAFPMGEDISNNAVLWSMSTGGQDLRQLSHDAAIETRPGDYAFSPDGTRVLFLGQPDTQRGSVRAFVVGADATGQHEVGYTSAAAWAPSGDRIAMTSGRQGGIRLVDVDGQPLGALAEGDFSSYDGLVFAPDGSRVYTVASPAEADEWAPDLYAIPVDGTEAQRLTTDHSVFPSTVQAIDPGRVLRQFGTTSVDTAAAAVTDNVAAADAVVVSPADDPLASLTAASLAAQLAAPALLSSTRSLSPQVLRAVRRLGASRVVLVGNLSSQVDAALRAEGLQVSRVGTSASPYSVSAAVSSRLRSRETFLVPVRTDQPGGWRLPLATAGFAAFRRASLLYTTPTAVPAAVRKVLRARGITTVTVVGGDAEATPRLLRQLASLGLKVRRVSSSDRYAVSARLADRADAAGASAEHPIVSSGAGPASVTAPALAALLGQATVIVGDRSLTASRPTSTWLRRHRATISTATLLGGVRVMRPSVEAQLEHAVQP